MARKLSDYLPGLKGDSPVLVDIALDLGDIVDSNQNEMLEFDAVASAVNFFRMANAATANAVVLSAQGDDTNVGLTLTPKGTGTLTLQTDGATTTTAVDVVVSGITSGKGIDLSDANALTSGIVLHIASSATAITGAGRLFLSDHTGATSTSGILNEFKSAATDETIVVQVTTAAMINGVALKLVGTTGMTTGSLLLATTSTAGAAATNGIVSIQATGAYTSTSNVGLLDVSATATTAGTVVHITSTAAGQTTAQLLNVTASGYTTGYTGSVVSFTGVSTTGAGNVLQVTGVNDTAGDVVKIVNNALTLGAGTLLNLSHTTSIIGAGSSMLLLTSTGIDTGTTTGTMLDLAATAAQTAHLVIITSASLTSGIGIKFTLAGLTTGSAIDTTGIAATKQNFNMNSTTGSTAAPQTNAPTGFFKIGIGGTDQWVPYYNST